MRRCRCRGRCARSRRRRSARDRESAPGGREPRPCADRRGAAPSVVHRRPPPHALIVSRCHGTRTAGPATASAPERRRSEEHTSELQSPCNLVCRLLLEKKKKKKIKLVIKKKKKKQ